MKIKNTEKNPFFNAYHDKGYIISHNNKNAVVLKEPRESREYRIENKTRKEIVVYKIDGGLVSSNDILKCDYGIYTEEDALFLVELKGADYIHAIEQLLSTICVLIDRPRINVSRLNARIILSKVRVPNIIPSPEKKLLKKVRSRNGDFIKKCQKLCEAV